MPSCWAIYWSTYSRAKTGPLLGSFDGLSGVFLLLALLALARIPFLEQLRHVSAGEWGNLLGLDCIPEVRMLRQKLKLLCAEAGRATRWNAALAREWIREAQQRQPQGVAFYVDGHVRVYHGELPRFTLIFDREGYSPDLFAELQKERIAALSYHRYPGQDWPLEEFQ